MGQPPPFCLHRPPRPPSHLQNSARATDHRSQQCPPNLATRRCAALPRPGPGQEPGLQTPRGTAGWRLGFPGNPCTHPAVVCGLCSHLPAAQRVVFPDSLARPPSPQPPPPPPQPCRRRRDLRDQSHRPRARLGHTGAHTQQPSDAHHGSNIQIIISQIIIIINPSPCVDSARLGYRMAFMTCSILHVMTGKRFMKPSCSLLQQRDFISFLYF